MSRCSHIDSSGLSLRTSTLAYAAARNSWGNSKYREPRPGDRLASVGSHLFGPCRFSAPFIAEGGAFTVGWSGVVYTPKSCLLHKSSNPNISQYEIEQALVELGASKVVWLEGDRDEIITNGHVDGYVLPTESGDILIQRADHNRNASARSADIGSIRSVIHQANPKREPCSSLTACEFKKSRPAVCWQLFEHVHAKWQLSCPHLRTHRGTLKLNGRYAKRSPREK